jgi:prevent-host-death family protein
MIRRQRLMSERFNVVQLKQSLGEILNRTEYAGERFVIHRRGKDAAAVIPIEDLRLLERLVREAEDRIDAERVEAARKESDERIPFDQVLKTLGMTRRARKRPTGVRD